jgi:hypothetical protein
VTRAASSLAGVGALVFAAAIVASNLIAVPAGLPPTGTEIEAVASFFAAKGAAVGLSVVLGPTAWIAASVFGAGVVAATRAVATDRGVLWALAGFAGVLLQNAAFSAVMALRLALASTGGNGADVLWPFHDAIFTLNGTFLALALAGLTFAGRSVGLVRPWHGTVGLVAAALLFTSATLAPLVVARAGPLGLIGLVGWLLWVVWLIAYGIALLRADATVAHPARA